MTSELCGGAGDCELDTRERPHRLGADGQARTVSAPMQGGERNSWDPELRWALLPERSVGAIMGFFFTLL